MSEQFLTSLLLCAKELVRAASGGQPYSRLARAGMSHARKARRDGDALVADGEWQVSRMHASEVIMVSKLPIKLGPRSAVAESGFSR